MASLSLCFLPPLLPHLGGGPQGTVENDGGHSRDTGLHQSLGKKPLTKPKGPPLHPPRVGLAPGAWDSFVICPWQGRGLAGCAYLLQVSVTVPQSPSSLFVVSLSFSQPVPANKAVLCARAPQPALQTLSRHRLQGWGVAGPPLNPPHPTPQAHLFPATYSPEATPHPHWTLG